LVLQAYIDDSGTGSKNSSDKVFVLSGFVAQVKQWKKFEKAWGKVLQAPPALENGLHMRKWAKKRRNADERDSKLKAFAEVIANHAERRIDAIIDIDAYRAHAAGKVPEEIDSPYFFSFHHLIARFCDDCLERGVDEQAQIAFDINLHFGIKARMWYQIVRDIVPKEYLKILPVDIYFKDDKIALPLQAADMLAYLRTNRLNRESVEFEWLEEELNNIVAIKCPILSSREIRHMVAGQSDNAPSEQLVNKWKALF